MSLHSTLFDGGAIAQLLRAQGEDVEYTPAEGEAAVELVALVGNKQAVRKDGRTPGAAYDHERLITLLKDADNAEFGGIAAPKKSGTIEYAGETYAILGIESEDVTATQLRCGYVGLADLAAEGTRRRR